MILSLKTHIHLSTTGASRENCSD